MPRSNQYSRVGAVNYAVKYALNPNPYYKYFSLTNTGGDCCNFLSQCLLAGGVPMNSSWWYRHGGGLNARYDTWSMTWSVANSLYLFLKSNQALNKPGIKGLEVNNPSTLELGDLLFYEENSGHIFHSAIVTGGSNNDILISQHSNEALNIPYLKSWSAKRIHFLKISI
jgi:hypothetical protein